MAVQWGGLTLQKSVEIAKRTIDLSISGSRTVCKIRVSGHSLPLLPGEYRINNPFCTHLPLPERSRQRTSCNAMPSISEQEARTTPTMAKRACWPLSLVQTPIRLLCDPKTGGNGPPHTHSIQSLSLSLYFLPPQTTLVRYRATQSVDHSSLFASGIWLPSAAVA